MCGCDDNLPSCSTSTMRRARKAHACWECDHVIEPGEYYQLESGVWDGRGDSYKWCQNCASIAKLCTELDLQASAAWRALPGPKYWHDAPEDFCFCFGSLREAAAEYLRGFGVEDRAA